MNRELSAGVDIGSTSIKGVLYDRVKDELIEVISESLDAHVATPPHYYEEDPLIIKDVVFKLLRELSDAATHHGDRLTSLAFTGQMHGGVFLDANLQPVSSFITWQDKRTEDKSGTTTYLQEIREKVDPAEWQLTGSNVFAGFFAGTWYWYKKNKSLPFGASKMNGIHDWMQSLLTGRHSTDPSTAAAWGLFAIDTLHYSSNIIEALDLDQEFLPEVIRTGAPVGNVLKEYAEKLGLEGVTVYCGLGDTQASYLGSGATASDLLANFGTGSQLMWERPQFERFPGTDVRYLMDGRYLVTVPTLAGGKSYAILAEFVQDVLVSFGLEHSKEEIYATLNTLAEQVSSSEGIQLTPFFNGSRFLGEELRGEIVGIDRSNFNLGNLTLAFLQGMVEELATPYHQIPPEKRPHKRIIASGNGVRKNAALRREIANIFDLPVSLSPSEEEAAIGAAKVCRSAT